MTIGQVHSGPSDKAFFFFERTVHKYAQFFSGKMLRPSLTSCAKRISKMVKF